MKTGGIKTGGLAHSQTSQKIFAIEHGVVIDHIPVRHALKVIDVLGVNRDGSVLTVGINLESSKLGHKDVVKIENKELSKEELNKIALIAPDATVSIIREGSVAEKINVSLPVLLENMLLCPNQNCITNHEAATTRFITVASHPIRIQCHFCERVVEQEDIRLRER